MGWTTEVSQWEICLKWPYNWRGAPKNSATEFSSPKLVLETSRINSVWHQIGRPKDLIVAE